MARERPPAVEREPVRTWRSTPLALWAGLFAIVLSMAVGWVALFHTRSSYEVVAQRDLLDGTRARAALLDSAAARGFGPAGADLVFDTFEPGHDLESMQLVLLGPEVRVRQATRESIEIDNSWSELRVRQRAGDTAALADLLGPAREVLGRIELDGEDCVLALVPVQGSGEFLATLVRADELLQAADRDLFPWWLAVALITLVLLPLPLILMARSWRTASLAEAAVRRRLEQSEASLSATMESLPFDVWVQDLEGRTLLQNERDVQSNGFLVGKTIEESGLAAEQVAFWRQGFERALRGESVHLDYTRGAADAKRWFHSILVPVRTESGIQAVTGVNLDLTELRRAELDLRMAHKRLSAHVENSPLAMIEWDSSSRVTRWSGGAERLFGWTSAEMLGRTDVDSSLVYDADRPAVAAVQRQLSQPGHERIVSLNRNVTRDGRVVSCVWYNSVVRDEAGEAESFLSLVQDVTVQQQASLVQTMQERVLTRILARASLHDVLATLLEGLDPILPGARSSVLLVDRDGQRLRSFVARHLEPAFTTAVDGIPIGPNVGSCGTAAFRRAPVITEAVARDPAWAGFLELASAHGIGSCWSQPVFEDEQSLAGTFALYFDRERVPTATELEILASAANLAGLAIERNLARKLEDTQRELLRSILEDQPLRESLRILVEGIEAQAPGMVAGVLLREAESLRLRPAAGLGLPPELVESIDALPPGIDVAICGPSAASRQRVVVEDFSREPTLAPLRPSLERLGLRAGWSQPILSASGEVLGTIVMLWRAPRAPNPREVKLIELASSLAGLAIERRDAQDFDAMQRAVTKMILDGDPLEDVLARLLLGIQPRMPGMRAVILVTDRERRSLRPIAGPSMEPEFLASLEGLEVRDDGSSCGRACHRRARTIVADVEHDELVAGIRPGLLAQGLRALWSNPVMSEAGEVLGTVCLTWREPKEPSAADIQLIEFTSHLAGLAIEKGLVREQQRRLNERLATLHEIGQAILAAGTPEGVASAALERVLPQIAAVRGSVVLVLEGQDLCRTLTTVCQTPTSVGAGFVLPIEELACGNVEQLRQGLVNSIPDVDALPEPVPQVFALLRQERVRSVTNVPLLVDGELIGSLNVSLDRRGPLPAEDVDFVREVADLISVALQQARLREKEQRLTVRLAGLNEVGRAILEADTVPGMALAALERCHMLVQCLRAGVNLFDEDETHGELVATVAHGATTLRAGCRFTLADLGYPERGAPGARSVFEIEDLARERTLPKVLSQLRDEGVRGVVCLPLLAQSRRLGYLNVCLARPGRLEPDEFAFVQELADLVAMGLHQSLLDRQLRQRAEAQARLSDRLATLNRIGAAILAARSFESLVIEALTVARQHMRCPGVALGIPLPGPKGRDGTFELLGVRGESNEVRRTHIYPQAYPPEHVQRLHTGQCVFITGLDQSLELHPSLPDITRDGTVAVLIVPMSSRGELLGMLFFSLRERGDPGPELETFGREIAALLAVGIEQQRLHEEVRRNAEQLEHRVQARTTELTEVNEELESYVRTVSHDLRAPLRAIQGLGTAVLEDFAPRLELQGIDYLARMVAAAERMDRMLLDLLAYSRLGKSEVVLDRVDLHAAVHEALNLVRSELELRHAGVELAPKLHVVRGHAPTLVQALSNLITNAAKFTAAGVKPLIRVESELRGRTVRCVVVDNGIGVAPEHHERIFGAFERLHGHDEYPGTGIGLAIVRRAIERMGGRAGIESREGEGSRFWIELPAGDRPA